MINIIKFKKVLSVIFWLCAIVLAVGRLGHAGTAYYFDPTATGSTNVLSDWTYDLNLAVPKSFAYGSAWLVGSGWDAATINDLTLVPGDRILIKD